MIGGALRRLVAAALLLALPSASAFALTAGRSLAVSGSCDDGTLAILPDAALSGGIELDGHLRTLAPAGADGVIHVEPGCDRLTIRVPPAFPLRLELDGGEAVHLGALHGPVDLTVRGSGDLHADALAGGGHLAIYGDGDVTVGTLSGADFRVESFGAGDFRAGPVTLHALTLRGTGNGDVVVGGGTIGKLEATTSGAGDIRVAASTGAATLTSTGDGDITVARVTGPLVQDAFGKGSVTVGAAGDAAPARPAAPVAGAHDVSDIPGDVGALLGVLLSVVLTVVGAAVALLVARRVFAARRRGANAAAPGAASRDTRVAELDVSLRRLAERTARIESFVTSREFELHRGFRELAR